MSETTFMVDAGKKVQDVAVKADSSLVFATVIRTSGNYIYIGNAPVGTASSDGGWRIKRLDTTTVLDVLWANGKADFNNIMDNYASLTYS